MLEYRRPWQGMPATLKDCCVTLVPPDQQLLRNDSLNMIFVILKGLSGLKILGKEGLCLPGSTRKKAQFCVSSFLELLSVSHGF